MNNRIKRKTDGCPVCKKYVFSQKYEICPVCGWENDPVQRKDPTFSGGANKQSLTEARKAYKHEK